MQTTACAGWRRLSWEEVGPAAQPVVPAVREALKDEYSNVREAAAEALKKIAPEETTIDAPHRTESDAFRIST